MNNMTTKKKSTAQTEKTKTTAVSKKTQAKSVKTTKTKKKVTEEKIKAEVNNGDERFPLASAILTEDYVPSEPINPILPEDYEVEVIKTDIPSENGDTTNTCADVDAISPTSNENGAVEQEVTCEPLADEQPKTVISQEETTNSAEKEADISCLAVLDNADNGETLVEETKNEVDTSKCPEEKGCQEKDKKEQEPWYVARAKRIGDYYNY